MLDQKGEPLAGVTVQVVGTTNGMLTNETGTYSLSNVASDAKISFSFIGMDSQEVTVNGRSTIDVILG